MDFGWEDMEGVGVTKEDAVNKSEMKADELLWWPLKGLTERRNNHKVFPVTEAFSWLQCFVAQITASYYYKKKKKSLNAENMIGLEILFQVKYLPYDNPRPFLSSLFLSASISDCILRHQLKKKTKTIRNALFEPTFAQPE